MKLTPKRPPGRPNRKALAYEAEIARLRSDGYPCEAIWEALLEAGVSLSRSSVKREVARLSKGHVTALRSPPPTAGTHGQRSTQVPPVQPPASSHASPSGKDVAAAWVRDRITNPLIRERIANESSSR
jgi:hypothetical protein